MFAHSSGHFGPRLLLNLTLVSQQQKWTTFSPLSGQDSYIGGGGGGPRNFIFSGILLFLLLRNPCKNLKSYDNPFWKNSDEGREGERKKGKKSMIIVVPSCLKDADGARTRSDQDFSSDRRRLVMLLWQLMMTNQS